MTDAERALLVATAEAVATLVIVHAVYFRQARTLADNLRAAAAAVRDEAARDDVGRCR